VEQYPVKFIALAEDIKMARKATVKKNPLKNNGVLFRLNPYAKTEKRQAQLEPTGEKAAKKEKKKVVYTLRSAVPVKTKEERKAERLAKQAAERAAKPKPVRAPKPKKVEPVVIAEPEPEPIAEPEPEPIVESEPEPVVEDVVEVEAEPVVESEPEPVVEVEPEPVVEAEPEPVVEDESEPFVEVEAEPEVEPAVVEAAVEQTIPAEPKEIETTEDTIRNRPTGVL
jgi:hypothetical protein